jgi:hypothetical protein
LGEFFTYWAIILSGWFLKITEGAQTFRPPFPRKKSYAFMMANKRVGPLLGRFFPQLIWSP